MILNLHPSNLIFQILILILIILQLLLQLINLPLLKLQPINQLHIFTLQLDPLIIFPLNLTLPHHPAHRVIATVTIDLGLDQLLLVALDLAF